MDFYEFGRREQDFEQGVEMAQHPAQVLEVGGRGIGRREEPTERLVGLAGGDAGGERAGVGARGLLQQALGQHGELAEHDVARHDEGRHVAALQDLVEAALELREGLVVRDALDGRSAGGLEQLVAQRARRAGRVAEHGGPGRLGGAQTQVVEQRGEMPLQPRAERPHVLLALGRVRGEVTEIAPVRHRHGGILASPAGTPAACRIARP